MKLAWANTPSSPCTTRYPIWNNDDRQSLRQSRRHVVASAAAAGDLSPRGPRHQGTNNAFYGQAVL